MIHIQNLFRRFYCLSLFTVSIQLSAATKTTEFMPNETRNTLNSSLDQAKTESKNELNKLQAWKAGETISRQSVEIFGITNCFRQLPIDKELFQRIYNKSYKKDCTISINDLRYIKVLHYDLEGQIHIGELICHKDISCNLIEIFKTLFNAHYPIERMVLIDNYDANDEISMQANNTSCFNFRKVAGTKILSSHSTGHAIDINPLYNPYVRKKNGKTIYQPKTSKKFTDRSKLFPYKIERGDLCYQLFKKHGFKWGGEWKSLKDFQHFEKVK